jgi:dihydroorotate dehydrogenase
MSGRWSEEQTTKFVNMYKDSENLWNVFTPEYKNREARLASLKHMVLDMNIPNFGVKDVSKKIKSLRSTYHLEVTKITKSKASGAGADEAYTPTIKWFNAMDYIIKNYKQWTTEQGQLNWSTVSPIAGTV